MHPKILMHIFIRSGVVFFRRLNNALLVLQVTPKN